MTEHVENAAPHHEEVMRVDASGSARFGVEPRDASLGRKRNGPAQSMGGGSPQMTDAPKASAAAPRAVSRDIPAILGMR